jgi:ribosomal protein S18 acetylase RimI-like enzyme
VTITCRQMREGEEDIVADQLRALAKEVHSPHMPTITGALLRAEKDTVRIVVAEHNGEIVGHCAWMIIYSTWRGAKGMYCSDLYVTPQMRQKNVGEQLLRMAAQQAGERGARYLKLEVHVENPRSHKFYERIGFEMSATDRQMFLEPENYAKFTGARP